MGLLNLALGQLLGLFLSVAGLLVALYFYDRSRRRVLVSTLQFWPRRPAPAVRQRHKRIQHPLSLLLQLAAVFLLLLAIADPRPGGGGASRHRVVVLDTSAAMALSDADGTPLMDQGRALALRYLESVPGSDRILLVEADGAPSVRVPFTSDRQRLREAILAAEPGWTALDLDAAFDLAGGTLRLALDVSGDLAAGGPGIGETVYVGPGLHEGGPVGTGGLPLLRHVATGEPRDAFGLLVLRAAADPAVPGKWAVSLGARSLGSGPASARVDFYFDDKPLGHRVLDFKAGGDSELGFSLQTERPGLLEARLAEQDDYPGNNAARIAIPSVRRTRLQVIGGSAESFEPLLASGARLEPSFVDSRAELEDDAIHVWARGGEAGSSRRAIYLAPPGTASPVSASREVRGRAVREWSVTHPLARGVRDRDLVPERARVFDARQDDEIVARTDEGPVVLARASADSRLVAFGFDLAGDSVRNRLAAPLLFANAVAWLDPDVFRAELVEARPAGIVEVEAPNSARQEIAVRTDRGEAVPWILAGGKVRFFAGRPGKYRVVTADRDVTLSLSQPQVASSVWDPPAEVRHGVPSRVAGGGEPWISWPWLAALAAAILLYDWSRFGRGRRASPEILPDDERRPEAGVA